MAIANQRFNLTPKEFFDLPFFVFLQLFAMTEDEKQKKGSRKFIVDGMRRTRKLYGWK